MDCFDCVLLQTCFITEYCKSESFDVHNSGGRHPQCVDILNVFIRDELPAKYQLVCVLIIYFLTYIFVMKRAKFVFRRF